MFVVKILDLSEYIMEYCFVTLYSTCYAILCIIGSKDDQCLSDELDAMQV